MNDSYYPDLSQISLKEFQHKLETQDLLPSRKILGENIQENFQTISNQDITNLQQLRAILQSKKKRALFSQETGLPESYLTILRREVNSYRPNPINLDKFPGIDPDHVQRLANLDIKNSRHLYQQTRTPEQISTLSRKAEIDPQSLQELIALSDLVRISGIGPVFARMMFDCDIQRCEDLSRAESGPLITKLITASKSLGYAYADFTEKDVQFCINFAQMLTKER